MKTFKDTEFGDMTGRTVYMIINCNKLELDSLEGCPKECKDFNASDNSLESLKYSPVKVLGDFLVRRNDLNSLIGGPKRVEGSYSIRNNKVKSLEGLATFIDGVLDIRGNSFKDLESILRDLFLYKVVVRDKIKTDFADFHQYDVDAYGATLNKLGKYKDFLNL